MYVSGPQGQRAGNKRKRQETETRGKRRGQGKTAGMFVPEGQRTAFG